MPLLNSKRANTHSSSCRCILHHTETKKYVAQLHMKPNQGVAECWCNEKCRYLM